MKRIEFENGIYIKVSEDRPADKPLIVSDMLWLGRKCIGSIVQIAPDSVVILVVKAHRDLFAGKLNPEWEMRVYFQGKSPKSIVAKPVSAVAPSQLPRPKFEVKGIRERKAHDGYPIYDATLYMDGVKVAEYNDDDWGGQPRWWMVEGQDAAFLAFDEYARSLPGFEPQNLGAHLVLDMDADLLMEQLILRGMNQKDFEKEIKKGMIVFRTPSMKPNEYKVMAKPFTAENAAVIEAEHAPQTVIFANGTMELFLDDIRGEKFAPELPEGFVPAYATAEQENAAIMAARKDDAKRFGKMIAQGKTILRTNKSKPGQWLTFPAVFSADVRLVVLEKLPGETVIFANENMDAFLDSLRGENFAAKAGK